MQICSSLPRAYPFGLSVSVSGDAGHGIGQCWSHRLNTTNACKSATGSSNPDVLRSSPAGHSRESPTRDWVPSCAVPQPTVPLAYSPSGTFSGDTRARLMRCAKESDASPRLIQERPAETPITPGRAPAHSWIWIFPKTARVRWWFSSRTTGLRGSPRSTRLSLAQTASFLEAEGVQLTNARQGGGCTMHYRGDEPPRMAA